MNREEYLEHGQPKKPKVVMDAFETWKLANNITERCDVHHRDDTEETRKYNTEHYERWGCNEDGTFEEGKYVIFMTSAEHTAYHRTGKKFSEEHRAKLSAVQKGISALYTMYKNNGGTLKWNDFHKALKNSEIILEDLL